MKKWSKIISLILVAVMIFSLVACNPNDNKSENDKGGEVDNNASDNSNGNNNDTSNDESDTEDDVENDDEVIFDDVTQYDPVVSDVSMESTADSFKLSETAYAKDEKFVYTSIVSFEHGVAAGLVFGAEDGSHYWVFNVDRQANLVKLLYFTVEGGKTTAVELLTDYFIGNDKMTDSERHLVGSKVANIDKVQLKVVITPEDDGVYAEFYAEASG